MPRPSKQIPKLSASDIVRFWNLVDKNGPLPDQANQFYFGMLHCWIWKGFTHKGYGRFSIHGHSFRSHRVAWEIYAGKIPDGYQVIHRCDDPSCVRPDHILLGTVLENILDKERKGRANQPTGEKHFSKTKPERVARGDRNGSRTHPESLKRGESHHAARLNPELIATAKDMASSGISFSSIARRMYVSRHTITRAIKGKTWKHNHLHA